jgi:hypothetical protein
LLFSKFKRIFKKSYILSTSVNSLCTTGTILKKFYDRKVFSICQLPTFKKFQGTNLIISTLKLKGFFVKKLLNLLKNKFALYPKPEGMGFTACFYKCPKGYPGYRKEVKLGKPMFGFDGEFHSKIRGRPFVFKECKNNNIVKLTDYSIAEIRSIKHLAEEANKEVYTSCEIDKHQLR